MIRTKEHSFASDAPVRLFFDADRRALFIAYCASDGVTDKAQLFGTIGYSVEVKSTKIVTCIVFETGSNNRVMIDAGCKTG